MKCYQWVYPLFCMGGLWFLLLQVVCSQAAEVSKRGEEGEEGKQRVLEWRRKVNSSSQDSPHYGTLAKRNGKCENFEKNGEGGGGVYPNPTSIFTVFNMGDPPTINVSKVPKCKINHIFLSLKNMTFPKGNLILQPPGVPTISYTK